MAVDFYKFKVAQTLIENTPFVRVYDELIPGNTEAIREHAKKKTPFAILKDFTFTEVARRTIGFQVYDFELSYNVEFWHKHIILDVLDPFLFHIRHQDTARARRLLLNIEDMQPFGLVTGRNPGVTTNRREDNFSITTTGILYEITIDQEL